MVIKATIIWTIVKIDSILKPKSINLISKREVLLLLEAPCPYKKEESLRGFNA